MLANPAAMLLLFKAEIAQFGFLHIVMTEMGAKVEVGGGV